MGSGFVRSACVAGLLGVLPAWSAMAPPARLADLADLDLEQLARVTVTSAVRREQPILEAPASLFVITAEDIRRSGATSLPEALRLAPNLQVARTDTSQYVVSARGGLTNSANKMLVLIDGRTVYTPLFSGVFYDSLAPLLEDVERIEVISGPGATLWGTNAVNGVINVTTRSARATQGTLVAAGAGTHEAGASLRHGWQAGAAAMRAYAQYFDRRDRDLEAGGSARDDARRMHAGFRADQVVGRSTTTWQAEAYGADVGNVNAARELRGAHVLGRFQGEPSAATTLMLQAYYDRTERTHERIFEETRDTVDLEGQHTTRFDGHVLSWGAGYRASRDRTVPTPALAFVPAGRTLHLATLFGQDEIRLAPRLVAIAGLRIERNSYTGVEWLPSLRLSWTLAPEHVAWAAASRAVRSPSRLDTELVVPGRPPFTIVNNPRFQSEIAEVAEAGYRGSFGAGSFSVTGFHHRLKRLRTVEPAGESSTLANGAEGRIQGIEAWGDLRPIPRWRIVWGFARMRHKVGLEPGRVNTAENPLGNNPGHTASLRSLWNIDEALQLDLFLRRVGRLSEPSIPAYTQLTARLGWKLSRELEVSVVGENLLGSHAEFGAPAVRAEFERSVWAKAAWSF